MYSVIRHINKDIVCRIVTMVNINVGKRMNYQIRIIALNGVSADKQFKYK